MSRFLCLSISGLLEPAGARLPSPIYTVKLWTAAPIIPFASSQCCYDSEGFLLSLS